MSARFHVGQKVRRNMGKGGGDVDLWWNGEVVEVVDGKMRVSFGDGFILAMFEADENIQPAEEPWRND